MANFKAVLRLFRRFTQASSQDAMDSLYRWLFGQISIDGITLDLDSTVMTRYGAQQGSAKGYNPAKRARMSHHPLMAFVFRNQHDRQLLAAPWQRRNCQQRAKLFGQHTASPG
jgi:hypothetical protein